MKKLIFCLLLLGFLWPVSGFGGKPRLGKWRTVQYENFGQIRSTFFRYDRTQHGLGSAGLYWIFRTKYYEKSGSFSQSKRDAVAQACFYGLIYEVVQAVVPWERYAGTFPLGMVCGDGFDPIDLVWDWGCVGLSYLLDQTIPSLPPIALGFTKSNFTIKLFF